MPRSAALLLLLASCASPVPRVTWRCAVDPGSDALFNRPGERWRGGDSICSVPLSKDSTLWLFGDTFVGRPGDPTRSGAVMIHNSLAIQHPPDLPEFYWRTVEGRPVDAIVPAGAGGFLWPLGGIREGPELHLFFTQVAATEQGQASSVTGNVLVSIENPDHPPGLWKASLVPVPAARPSPDGDLLFGSSVLFHDGFFYVFGVREDSTRRPIDRRALVARTPSLPDFKLWKFLGKDGWGDDVKHARALFDEAAAEMSVTFLPATREFVATYTRLNVAPEILVRRAPRPEGPYGFAQVVYRPPERSWNARYYTYASKAHPELALEDNELVISYAASSQAFNDLLKDLRLYWPRFIRARLD